MSSRFRPYGFVPRRVPPSRAAEQELPFGDAGPESRALTVSQFVGQINGIFRGALPDTWIKGEVGEWRIWPSGHAYFTLKDRAACLNAMMFEDDLLRVPFRVEAGMELLARGRPDVYAKSGKLSFIAIDLQPAGIGALQLAFEQLKARLAAEGLFDQARKRALPLLPRRIGVVTSRSGAAIRDILKVLSTRFPNAHVTIYPAAVQGTGAAEEISRAIRAFSRWPASADVLLVARGGGSKEDLAAFNDERVVRAVAASRIPTISAVGHEVDVTLTDLAADRRAATPSQAAEMVVAQRADFESLLERCEKELKGALRAALHETRAALGALLASDGFAGFSGRVRHARLEVTGLARALVGSVRGLPAVYGERLGRAEGRVLAWPERVALPLLKGRVEQESRALVDRLDAQIARSREHLGVAAGQLVALDPLRVLARGYSVTYREGDSIPLTDAARVTAGDTVRVVLARGEIGATVTESRTVPKKGVDGHGES